jgi:outer membrane lipoprotein-sorting protein
MNCRECKNLLIEYAEGSLDGHPKEGVEQHLEQCPQCRKEIENIRLLEDRILQNSLSFRSIDLEESIMDRIAGERSIRLKAASSAGFFHQIRSLFMENAVLKIASAAAVLAFFFIIAFWNRGSPSTIVWADVQGRLNQVHTLTYSALAEISEPTGMRMTGRFKAYFKDPGLARAEEYPPDSIPGSAAGKPKRIVIIRCEPGSNRILLLYPESSRAELSESVFLTDGSKPPFQPPLDSVSFNWELIKEITADKTRRIGNRVINGISAVGFEFDMPEWVRVNMGGQIHAQLWASGNDGTPLLLEVEYRDSQGQNGRVECSDFLWNIPLDESLFDLAVPEGWSLNRTRTESKSAEYANAGLAPGVTLQIGPDGRAPLADTEDVTRVVRGQQTTIPDAGIPPDVRITIELKPDAIQRLRNYARANPDELIIVDFNRQIKVAANLKEADPSQLSFDLSLLDLPLAELEARYFTTTVKRNGL